MFTNRKEKKTERSLVTIIKIKLLKNYLNFVYNCIENDRYKLLRT